MDVRPDRVDSDAADAVLVDAARTGDVAALAVIYDRYAPRLVDYARGIVGPAGAEDVVHDAFVGAAQRLDQLRDPDALRAWLYRITHRTAITHLRRRRAEPSGLDMDMIGPESYDDLDRVEAGELGEIVASAEDGLEDRDRELLRLLYRHDLTPEEAAEVLDLRPSQIHDRSFRARERFARSLDAVTVARAGRDDCTELDGLLSSWDGSVTPKWRKRISRHLDRCGACDATRKAVSSPSALLSVPVVALAAPAMRETTLSAMSVVLGVGVGPNGNGAGSEGLGSTGGSAPSSSGGLGGPSATAGSSGTGGLGGSASTASGAATSGASGLSGAGSGAASSGAAAAGSSGAVSSGAASSVATAKTAAVASTPMVTPVDVTEPGAVSSLIGAVAGPVTVAVGLASGAPVPPPAPPAPAPVVVAASKSVTSPGAPVELDSAGPDTEIAKTIERAAEPEAVSPTTVIIPSTTGEPATSAVPTTAASTTLPPAAEALDVDADPRSPSMPTTTGIPQPSTTVVDDASPTTEGVAPTTTAVPTPTSIPPTSGVPTTSAPTTTLDLGVDPVGAGDDPTTTVPTTVAPTTTAAPATTVAPTTTAAPATTVAPTTTATPATTAAPTTTAAPATTAAPTTEPPITEAP